MIPLLVIGAPHVGRCASAADKEANARVVQAFEDAVRDARDSGDVTPPPHLRIERAGYSWSLTARKEAASASEQLTCLLCTTDEAAATAEFLGRRSARETGDRPVGKESSLTGIPAGSPHGETTVSFDDAPSRGPIVRTRVAVVATGLGIAAAAAGGVFLSLNGECAVADCEYRHYLKTPGIALIAAGATLVTAAILLWRIRHNPSPKTKSRGAL